MTDPGTRLERHPHSRAVLAWRAAAGNRKEALAHLEAMAGQDVLLTEAIRQAGLGAALKVGKDNYETLARTAGQYVAAHPD